MSKNKCRYCGSDLLYVGGSVESPEFQCVECRKQQVFARGTEPASSSRSSGAVGYATGGEINTAGLQWLKENPNSGVPYSMTTGYWNSLKSNLAVWGFRIVKE